MRFDAAHNRPDDIVAVSRQFPDMQFVVFHGAWDKNHVEGPYDPNATIGIDTFLRALDDHGVPPNDNVWVDVGTVWREVLRDPTTAAHTIGQAAEARRRAPRALGHRCDLVRIAASPAPGVPRVHDLERVPGPFGYPALTDALKAQVLGLNAAELFDLDVARDAVRARERSAHQRADHGRASPRRRRAPRRLAAERPDDPARDAPVAPRPDTHWTPI